MPAAKTGREARSKNLAIRIAQVIKGSFSKESVVLRAEKNVTIKFSLPKIEEIPDTCRAKITRSTLFPG